MCEWQCCALLKDPNSYQPDTIDLYKDRQAAEYWFSCFRDIIAKLSKKAALSQNKDDPTAEKRADDFREAYINKLNEFQSRANECSANEGNREQLSIRELLSLNDIFLHRFGFRDPWLQQKQTENNAAIALLVKRLEEIDKIENVEERWTELVRGVLAGNMFDWGAQAVINIVENDENFGLYSALQRIESRPWLIDDLNKFLQRVNDKNLPPHKCAAIFVDNSGIDIVLGILPFARELLKRGTKVLLCANAEPSLNDVTANELENLLDKCVCKCSILQDAWTQKRLLVYGNGQGGPCLDMRKLPQSLCQALEKNETDLLVIEGMGRALHTNLYAKFTCETLKLAVIKNKWLAQRLGGDIFAVICKYES